MVVNRDLKEDFFHKRDIEEILIDGKLPTCSDLGILFRGLMIAQGISTSYVETFHEDFILKNKLHTHTFAKILKDNPYDDIDTSNPLSSNFYYFINPDFPMAISPTAEGIFPYIIFKEGLDSWDMDIRSHEDILSARDNDLENLLVSYRKNLRGKFDEKHFEYDEF
jgi:hypothetical protein